MILSKRVSLGGVQLDELHERIVIRSIDSGVPKENISTTDRMGGYGQRITGQHWEALDVNVGYAIDIPKREFAERRAVFDLVNTWAMKTGWLVTNERPGQKIYIDKTVFPSAGDLWDWTSEYKLVFRAYNVPFWQNDQAALATSGITSGGSVWLNVDGNVDTVVDATFANRSGMTINNFWVQVSGNRITLKNMELGGSETLRIHHGTDGLLRIQIGSRSVYDRYTGADDLYTSPGDRQVSFGADRAGILTAQCAGRWV